MKGNSPRRVKAGEELYGAAEWNEFLDWVEAGRPVPGQAGGLSIRQGKGGTTFSVKVPIQGIPLFCSPTGTIAAGGAPGSGTPGGPLSSQVIYQIINGAWVEYDPSGKVYNGLQDATVITKTLIVLQNADGTYTAIQQGCT